MQRNVLNAAPWLALGVGVIILAATNVPPAFASPHDASAGPAAPRLGDQALYDVLVGDAADGPAYRLLMEWTLTDVVLPGGVAHGAPTVASHVLAEDVDAPGLGLATSAPAPFPLVPSLNPGKDYSANEPVVVEERRVHLDAVPGSARAETTVWRLVEDVRDGTRSQWSERSLRADACDVSTPEGLLARVAGRDARAAEDAVLACGGGFASAADGTWTLTSPDGSVRIDLAPHHSLPMRIEFAAASFDGAIAASASLVAWRGGDGALTASDFPPEPPALPLVAWTAEGPAEGDFPAHPFRSARRALEQQSDVAAAYFAHHADARVYFATHAWNGAEAPATTPLDPARPWAMSVKGVRCGAAGTGLIESAGGDWTASWIGERGSLFTVVEQVAAPALPAPVPRAASPTLERVAYAKTDGYATRDGGTPATMAPAPDALVARLRDVDAFRTDGVYSIDYAFVPTDHGNVDGAAAVSRGVCMRDPVTNHVWYRGASVWFVDGRAAGVVHVDVQRETRAPMALANAEPTPADGGRPLLADAGWTLAGSALVGGGAAVLAPRLLQAGYTRITRATALSSPARRRILEVARERPGISFNALADALGVHRNTVEHHVRVLARHREVRLGRNADGILVYPADDPRAGVAHVIDLANTEAILERVIAAPGGSQREVARALGLRESHTSELMRLLERDGLVERRRHGREVRIYPTERSAAIVERRA